MAWQEEDDDLDETEDPDESDQDDEDDPSDVVTCPRCGREVYEHADRCPHCGEYVTPGTASSRPWWVIVAAILTLLAILLWLVF